MLTEYFYIQLQQSTGLLLPLDNINSVVTLNQEQICQIPGVLPALLGVTNQRGRLLWVFSLSDFLELNQLKLNLNQHNMTLIVLTPSSTNSTREQAERQLGCVVSLLNGIVSLNPNQFKPVPDEFPTVLGSFSSGVAEVEQSLVAVLNVNAVFTALSNLDTSLVLS
jgi:twitching motility protein PilI